MSGEPTTAADSAADGYRVGDLVIDLRQRRVTRDGVDLGVTSLSFDLLLGLISAAPNLVAFDTLMDVVWRGVVVSPETLTQRVKLLRRSLGDSADKPRYIQAVRGHGYRLAIAAEPFSARKRRPPAVNPLSDSTAERPGSPLAGPPAARARRWLLAAPVALLIVAAVLVGWVLQRDPTGQLLNSSAASPLGSIAILPFANLTGDPSKEYLSDGMAEEMINALGQVPGLRVPARTSSFAYKNRNVDLRRVAHDLGVDTILEGGVRSAGERIRITVQMVDARTGYQIWSQAYDREFADILELQKDMAGAVVRAFRRNLEIDLLDSAVSTSPTRDVEAYQFFLQAESVVNGTAESFLAAIALYNEALARDPTFARALAGRALNRAALAWTGSSFAQGLEGAQQDAEAALELDRTLSLPHVVLASLNVLRGDWSSAEARFRTAVDANPGDADFRGRYAISLLLPTGQLRKARAEAEEARRIAPGNAFPQAMLSFVEQALGADQNAIRLADAAISRGGDPRQMAPVYASAAVRRGAYREAADHAIDAMPPDVRDAGGAATLQLAYAALGDPANRPAAVAALEKLTREPAWDLVDPRNEQIVLYLYAALGELDILYDEMDRLFHRGAGSLPEIIAIGSMWSPEMRPFREDPRFDDVVERLGLVDYWMQSGPPDGCELAGRKLSCL